MKKIAAVSLSIVGVFAALALGNGCTNYVHEKYGAWDGNYLYCEEMRCKTTGEEEENLVRTVTTDDGVYEVEECTHCLYAGDDAYFCVRFCGEKSCLVRYNIKDKIKEVVFMGTEKYPVYSVFECFESKIILRRESGGSLYSIDCEGNIIEENSERYEEYWYAGEYIIEKKEDKYYYRLREDEQLTFFAEESSLSGEVISIEYVPTEKKGGFLIETYCERPDQAQFEKLEAWGIYKGIYYYDLERGKTEVLLSVEEEKNVERMDDYFLVYSEGIFTARDETFLGIPTSRYDVVLRYDCALYKLGRSQETVWEHIYTFEKDKSVDLWQTTADTLDLSATWIGKSGVAKSGYYVFYFATATVKEEDWEWFSRAACRENGVRCGKYIYYLYFLDIGVGGNSLYYFERYDTETEKTEIMQYREEGEESHACSFIEEKASEFLNGRFAIRNY